MDIFEAWEAITKYPWHWPRIAETRLWAPQDHVIALMSGDVDSISITHPSNFLTEEEVEHDCGKGQYCPQFGEGGTFWNG